MMPALLLFFALFTPAELPQSDFLQKPVWKFREFHAPDVLSHEEVWDIIQAQDGAIWFSTGGGGVVRLFKGIRTVYDKRRGLAGNFARTLKEDSHGGVWVGTSEGISYIDGSQITNFTSHTPFPILDGSIESMAIDGQERVWFGTNNRQLIYFSPDSWVNRPSGTWEIQPVQFDKGVEFRNIIFDSQENMWLAQGYGGLCVITKNSEQKNWQWDNHNICSDMVKRQDGSFWLCGDHDLISFSNGTIQKIITSPYKLSAVGELEGQLLVGTFADGLFYLRGDQLVPVGISDEHLHPYIECIVPTPDGAVWIGTREGAYRISRSSWQFMDRMPDGDQAQARTLTRHPNGSLYLTDNAEDLYTYHDSHWDKIATLPIEPMNPNNLEVNFMTSGPDGKLYYLHRSGLFMIDPAHLSDIQKIPLPDGFIYYDTERLFFSQNGNLWLTCHEGTYHRIDGQWQQLTPCQERSKKDVFGIFEPQRDTLWILGRRWIEIWNHDGGKLLTLPTSYTDYTDEWGQLRSGIEQKGVCWIATGRNGLLRYDGIHWTHYHQKDGLPSEGISELYSAHDDTLWVGSYRTGISSLRKNRWITYGLADGVPNGQIDTILEDSDGNIWADIRFEGIACYKPDQNEPAVWIDSQSSNLLPNERGVFSFDARDVWNETQQKDLVFSWRIIQNKNKTILQDWTNYDTRKTMTTPRLKPGAYTLQVIAQDKDRNTSSIPAVVVFNVSPYFWTTPQFLIPVGISLLIAAASLIVWYKKHQALHISEMKYRNLIEKDSLTLLVNWNQQGKIIYCNECAERFFGVSFPVLNTASIFRWITSDDAHSRKTFEETVAKAISNPDIPQECRLSVLLHSHRRWLTWFFRAIPGNRTKRELEIHAVGVDITQQVLAEKELLQEKMSFQEFCNSVQIGICHITREGMIQQINPILYRLIGLPVNQESISSILDIPWENNQIILGFLERISSSPHPVSQLLIGKRMDNQSPFFLFTSGQTKNENIQLLVLDYTEQKWMEEKLAKASSAEQERLGRELHDGLGQQLTGLMFLGSLLEKKLNSLESEYKDLAHELNDNLQTAVQQTRNLSRGLYPVSLERAGLHRALEELIESYHVSYPTPISLQMDQEMLLLDQKQYIHIYRIIREACFNALKHAKAQSMTITGKEKKDKIVFEISDDGIGMNLEIPKHTSQGMGLSIMKYHANRIGGDIRILKNPYGGTTVQLSIRTVPISRQ